MSDSEDSNFSEEEDSERSSDGEEAEVEEERRSVAGSEKEEEPEEEEEEEEEEEYDEEEEEEDDDRPPKKPRHGGFILDEADVDDEYEDEDQWEDGAEDILEKASNIDNVVLDEDRSGARRLQNLWRDQREEELGEYYMKKYAKSSVGETVYGGSDELSDDITQQQLLPGVKDPNLWTVKCKIGEERATAISLMRKFIAYQFTDTVYSDFLFLSESVVVVYVFLQKTFVSLRLSNLLVCTCSYYCFIILSGRC